MKADAFKQKVVDHLLAVAKKLQRQGGFSAYLRTEEGSFELGVKSDGSMTYTSPFDDKITPKPHVSKLTWVEWGQLLQKAEELGFPFEFNTATTRR